MASRQPAADESMHQPVGGLALLLGFFVVAGIYLAWGICDTLTDLGGDSATYMLVARALSPLLPPNPLIAQGAAGAISPPLFPALIGLFGGSFAAAHVLVVASLLVSLLLLYLWLRWQNLGVGMSAVAALLFAMLPGTYLLALNIWSENTYLCLSLLTLFAVARAQSNDASELRSRWWWTAIAAAAGAAITRSAGLTLLLALTGFVSLRRPLRWWLMIFMAWLPFLLWAIWSRLHASGTSVSTEHLYRFYGKDFFPHLVSQLALEAPALVDAWLAIWLGGPASWPLVLLILAFGALCLSSWAASLWQKRFDAIYVLSYLCLVMVWPWPSEAVRFLYVIVPVLLGYGMRAIWVFANRFGQPARGAILFVVSALLALTMLPSLLICIQRRFQEVPADIAVIKHVAPYYSDFPQNRTLAVAIAELITDLPLLPRYVASNECIFQIKPSAVLLLSGRSSQLPPPSDANDEEFTRGLQKCRYAYLVKGQSSTFPAAFYPRDRLHNRYRVLTVLWDKIDPQGGEIAELVELMPPDRNVE